MNRILMILEVSRKQDYIFSSKKLRENAARSGEIAYVTSSAFFQTVSGDVYDEEENLVYTGGGHTVLQFASREAATRFAVQVTGAAMERYDGMEVFVKQLPYAAEKTPGENLKKLTEALERKKALRKTSFRYLSLGVEALDPVDYKPRMIRQAERSARTETVTPPEKWRFPTQFTELSGDENFIAVVHVDGNAMGKRVQKLYERADAAGWDACRASLQRFSQSIQADFEQAFRETVDTLLSGLPGLQEPILPIRPVILAGDDVCFVTAGSIGLECARVFLEHLAALKNQEDGQPYAACAGVALVHRKFPFHQAYDMAEQLCDSAKRFGAELDPESRVSAMDWHIEFGQLKGSLAEIREDYASEDGGRMELRPVVVTAPDDIDLEKTGGIRTYAFFRELCQTIQNRHGRTVRGKLKNLRTAAKQGAVESRFFLRDKQLSGLLDHVLAARYPAEQERIEPCREFCGEHQTLQEEPFRQIDDTSRCLFFDAIEMSDHFRGFQEAPSCTDK